MEKKCSDNCADDLIGTGLAPKVNLNGESFSRASLY